ncbi:hypothetical protein D3C81_2145810 [compost metagenome]
MVLGGDDVDPVLQHDLAHTLDMQRGVQNGLGDFQRQASPLMCEPEQLGFGSR